MRRTVTPADPAAPAARSVLALVLAAALAACTNGVTPAPSGAPTPSAAGSPSAAASSIASPVTSPVASPSAVASASPPPATSTAAPEPSPSGPFACGYPFERAASRTDSVALIRDVRVAAHDAYDRIVFELLGSGVPKVRIERVSPPFVKDPSGLPLSVAGSSFIKVTLSGASGAGYATPSGTPSYTGATTFNSGFVRLTSFVQAGDFEGITTWIAGLAGPMCYAVSELPTPARLVIDLRAS